MALRSGVASHARVVFRDMGGCICAMMTIYHNLFTETLFELVQVIHTSAIMTAMVYSVIMRRDILVHIQVV